MYIYIYIYQPFPFELELHKCALINLHSQYRMDFRNLKSTHFQLAQLNTQGDKHGYSVFSSVWSSFQALTSYRQTKWNSFILLTERSWDFAGCHLLVCSPELVEQTAAHSGRVRLFRLISTCSFETLGTALQTFCSEPQHCSHCSHCTMFEW